MSTETNVSRASKGYESKKIGLVLCFNVSLEPSNFCLVVMIMTKDLYIADIFYNYIAIMARINSNLTFKKAGVVISALS